MAAFAMYSDDGGRSWQRGASAELVAAATIGLAWILTLPAVIILSGALYWAATLVTG